MRSVAVVVAFVGILLIAFGHKQNEPQVASDSDVLTYVLEDQPELLYASEGSSGPVIGGLSRTPSVTITLPELRAHCAAYLRAYRAIVADGEPTCLRGHRSEAATYVRGRPYELSPHGFTVFVSAGGAR